MDNPAVQLEYDSSPDEYLEPNVQRHAGVIPKSVCKELIDLGEEGICIFTSFLKSCRMSFSLAQMCIVIFYVSAGFLVQEESIDKPEQNDPNAK